MPDLSGLPKPRPKYMCQHGNCNREGTAEEMIVVSGAGYRDRYCSWIHAAAGALHRMYPHLYQNEPWAKMVSEISNNLDEAFVEFRYEPSHQR